MNSIEQILSRRSVRRFKKEPIKESVMQNIIEAGRLAPSATNQQAWHFIVATDEAAKQACTFGNFNRFAGEAACVIVGVYKKSEAMIAQYNLMDVTIALQNMVVAAWVQGVGSCWIGAFDEAKLRRRLELPSDAVVVGGIALGIPEKVPAMPRKKPASETFHFDKW